MDNRPYLFGPHLIRDALIEKVRTLPLGGEVLVAEGDTVEPGTVVAHLNPEGYLHFVNVARELDVPYNLAEGCLVKNEGDTVARGEVIAARPAALGLLVAECRSPTDGVIEKIYPSGHLTIRSHPIPVEAFVGGRVVETVPGNMVVILTAGTLVQGVYGRGGERHGPLVVLEPGRGGPPPGTPPGAVVATPEPARAGLIQACLRAKASALVAPSAHLADLPAGDALVFVLTEGFGSRPMSRTLFETLAALAGHEASVSGVTQLRAGVERPEVIIRHGPVPQGRPSGTRAIRLGRRTRVYVGRSYRLPKLGPGVRVRLVRAPHFGLEGEVAGLPPEPRRIATGAVLPVAEVRLDDGRTVTVPRCNLEVLELDPGAPDPSRAGPGLAPGESPTEDAGPDDSRCARPGDAGGGWA